MSFSSIVRLSLVKLFVCSFFYIQGIARPLKNEDKGEAKEKRAREAGEETYRKQAREAGREAKNKGKKDERRKFQTGSETASVGLKGQSLTEPTRMQTRLEAELGALT